MTHFEPTRRDRRLHVSDRKTSPLALIVFAIAALGVLAITFAPDGYLRAQPAASQSLR
jgi:hypothetical protein